MDAITHLFLYSVFFSLFRISITQDSITPSQPITDGGTTVPLVSASRTFQFGFFSPGNSNSRYVGIWYTVSSKTVVWVANREASLSDHSGVLKVTRDGILVLLNSTSGVVWSSNTSRTVENPVAQLLDTGNLVVKDRNDDDPEKFLWQSFDYPCDTLLSEMKLGWNFATGLQRVLSSWKSMDDPAQGAFSLRLDPRGLPQMFSMEGDSIMTRAGSWNGLRFTGFPKLRPNPVFEYEVVFNEKELFYEYKLLNTSVLSRVTINTLGVAQRFNWVVQKQSWELLFSLHTDECDNYGLCGEYGTCNINKSPECACMEGFLPKSPKNWDSVLDWSDGCVRRTPLECNGGDGFLKRTGIKLPDTSSSWYNKSMTLQECKGMCLKNCNCTAYASLDVRGGGSGCVLWFGSLIDTREYSNSKDGQNLYIRMAASELDLKEKQKMKVIVVIGAAIGVVFVVLLITYCILKKKTNFREKLKNDVIIDQNTEGQNEDLELPLFDLSTICNVTDNFSSKNKLGEGGFGPVYKGTLVDGQEIAVKRLSRSSGQGLNEFKNEVTLIAKLQHRNLVRLLGCCIQGDEKMLVYEYMPNRSLDSFIFDKTRAKILGWSMRFHIICGIARGLLYLHEDSRLRIIHRDLKTSNILLDSRMNPKISDFGVARICGEDQIEGSTNRVVGTYGYMAPEYAINGLFSVKSDVFSFGILLLEIVSGKRNRRVVHSNQSLNLIGHAWELWREGRHSELIDECLGDSCTFSEALRCLHVGLLCVQQHPEERPNMLSVVTMLSSDNSLPEPKEPGFYVKKSLSSADSSWSKEKSSSTNYISITSLDGR